MQGLRPTKPPTEIKQKRDLTAIRIFDCPMPKPTPQQPITAQSLGALLKSARDIMRKDEGRRERLKDKGSALKENESKLKETPLAFSFQPLAFFL